MGFESVIQDEIESVGAGVSRGSRVVSIAGLSSIAAKALVISRLQSVTGKKFAVITDSNVDADRWYCDLLFYREHVGIDRPLYLLPSFETDPYSGISPHAETLERRALALWELNETPGGIAVMPARSLITRTAAPARIAETGITLSLEKEFPVEILVERLTEAGYVREEPVSGVGQFSTRGGIVDIWSSGNERPIRMEFFGDTVDSIREF